MKVLTPPPIAKVIVALAEALVKVTDCEPVLVAVEFEEKEELLPELTEAEVREALGVVFAELELDDEEGVEEGVLDADAEALTVEFMVNRGV